MDINESPAEHHETLPTLPEQEEKPDGAVLPAGAVIDGDMLLMPAGFWPRFGAFLIDFAILSLLHQILMLVAGVELPGPDQVMELLSLSLGSLMSGSPSEAAMARIAELNAPLTFSGWSNVALCGIYFTVFHGSTGQSLGKLVLGIRALRANGTPLGYGWALLRYVLYFLSSRLIYTAWTIPFDRQRRTLYDMIAGTNVFRRMPLPEGPASDQ